MRTTKALFVRPLTDAARAALEESLRSPDAFVLRRAQIVLARAAGERTGQVAPRLGFTPQAVREVIRAFNARGLDVLRRRSSRPGVIYSAFDTPRAVALRDLLQQSPRLVDQPTSVWTLEVAAAVAYEQGVTATRLSGATIRATLARMGVQWRRAKEGITSPDPEYARKRVRRDRLIRLAQPHPDWLLGFEDGVWGRRLARPTLHTWQDDEHPLRLIEQAVARDDPAPKALACYGLLARWWADRTQRCEERRGEGAALRRGPPRQRGHHCLLGLVCSASAGARQARRMADRGQRLLALLHDSQIVRAGLRQHNRRVKQSGQGVRLLACSLPTKSPWLNPIEPKWWQGKRKVVEPNRLLTATERADRVGAVYGCAHDPHHDPHLVTPTKAPAMTEPATLVPPPPDPAKKVA